MTTPRARNRERGNSLLLALIVMSSLATLGSLTVVSVQSSLKASTNDRSHTVATYAAESGAAVAMEYLRTVWVSGGPYWSAQVNRPDEANAVPAFPSNGAAPGTPNNPFSVDQNASYSVEIVNNRNDPGFAAGDDLDGQVIIRSTGRGPQGSVAIVEWEVRRFANPASEPPAPPPPAVWPRDAPMILVAWHLVL